MKILKILLSVAAMSFLIGCGGGSSSSDVDTTSVDASVDIPVDTTVDTSTINEDFSTLVSYEPDREKTDWTILSFTSELTGEETTRLYSGSADLDASFAISCSGGIFDRYYIDTGFVTGSGYVAYRFGDEPITYTTWAESPSSGYDILIPPSSDISFIEKFQYTPDVVFQLDKFDVGLIDGYLRNDGFSAMIDQTRQACGWSEYTFPPRNGWDKEYPTTPPEWAKESTYDVDAVDQFRLIAWIDQNSQGMDQLLVRLGDEIGPCEGPFLITDNRLFVIQDGKKIPVVAASKLSQTCKRPSIYALNGNFDINRPFILNEYISQFSIGDHEKPVTSISFP